MILTQHGMNSIRRTRFENIGGKDYRVIKVGSLLWMAENLDYADSNINVNSTNVDNAGATKMAYNYRRDSALYGSFGMLYNYACASYIDANSQSLFNGFRVPTLAEFTALVNSYGVTALKSKDWNGTDDIGFSAQPYGYGAQISGSVSFWPVDQTDPTATDFLTITSSSNRYKSVELISNSNAAAYYDNQLGSPNYLRLVKDI